MATMDKLALYNSSRASRTQSYTSLANALKAPAATTTPAPAATPVAATPATPTTPPSVSSITGSDDLATALNKLINQFNATPQYQARTEDELRERATGEYQSYYDQLRLAAQQAQDRSVLALNQQRENIGRTYDEQREASLRQYQNAYSQADRSMLNRGMQRSTYAGQTLANIATQGAEAQQQLWTRQGQDQGQVDAQIAQLATQLAQQLNQYDASQASDILNRIRALEDQDYERGVQNMQYRNTLSSQIYEYLMQNAQFEENKRQFNQKMRMKAADSFSGAVSSGGGGGRSYSSSGGFNKTTSSSNKNAGSTPSLESSVQKALSGIGSSSGGLGSAALSLGSRFPTPASSTPAMTMVERQRRGYPL